jgi:hypothetical protein
LIDFYQEQLRYQIEGSPFSEDFIISVAGDEPVCLAALDGTELTTLGSGEGELRVRGIFDESVERETGNKAIRNKPRLYVYRWINPMPQSTKVIVRGKEYAATSYDKDANTGIVVWLR